jgi:hypothetical protein
VARGAQIRHVTIGASRAMVLRWSATLVLAGALALGCRAAPTRSTGRGTSLRDTTDAKSADVGDGETGDGGAADATDDAAASGQADANADASAPGASGSARGPRACVLGSSVLGACVLE